MSIEVNGEHLGGVRSFTAPLGCELPLTDLLGLWGPQTRTGVGLITQRTGGPTDIADLEICGKVTPMEHKTACKVATTGLQDPNVLKSDPMWPEVPDEQTWIWTK